MKKTQMKTRKDCKKWASKKFYEMAFQDVSTEVLRKLGERFSSRSYYNKFNENLIFEICQIKVQGFTEEVCSITGIKEEDIPKAGFLCFESAQLAVESLEFPPSPW